MLSVGIIGLPNVGKSTLFNALRSAQGKLSKPALVANYPFATIEPNVGVVPVPDDRLLQLAQLVKDEEKMDSLPPIVPAVVEFVDIAGLVKGASQGEGLGNQFLSHIREVEAIVEVVRNFSDENVIRSGSINPQSDIEVVNTELVLTDLQTVEKRIQSQGIRQRSGEIKKSTQAIQKIKEGLDDGQLVSQMNLSDEERMATRDLQLLTAKPIIYVYNSDEGQVVELSSREEKEGVVFVSAKLEAELSALSQEEQKAYLAELNIKESGLDKVIKKAYETLGLITFLTAGPKEVRAWTLRRGTPALRASGTIHSDFERGFIAAEVVACDPLLAAGSRQKAKELGQIRLEGKEYEMKDGDVVEFRFSV